MTLNALRKSVLKHDYFEDFENIYGKCPYGKSKRKESDSKEARWKSFHISEIKENGYKFDSFKWISDDSVDSPEELPQPEELAQYALEDLMAASEEIQLIIKALEAATEVDS